jgi:hypothetical protein
MLKVCESHDSGVVVYIGQVCPYCDDVDDLNAQINTLEEELKNAQEESGS